MSNLRKLPQTGDDQWWKLALVFVLLMLGLYQYKQWKGPFEQSDPERPYYQLCLKTHLNRNQLEYSIKRACYCYARTVEKRLPPADKQILESATRASLGDIGGKLPVPTLKTEAIYAKAEAIQDECSDYVSKGGPDPYTTIQATHVR